MFYTRFFRLCKCKLRSLKSSSMVSEKSTDVISSAMTMFETNMGKMIILYVKSSNSNNLTKAKIAIVLL